MRLGGGGDDAMLVQAKAEPYVYSWGTVIRCSNDRSLRSVSSNEAAKQGIQVDTAIGESGKDQVEGMTSKRDIRPGEDTTMVFHSHQLRKEM